MFLKVLLNIIPENMNSYHYKISNLFLQTKLVVKNILTTFMNPNMPMNKITVYLIYFISIYLIIITKRFKIL